MDIAFTIPTWLIYIGYGLGGLAVVIILGLAVLGFMTLWFIKDFRLY